MAFQQQVTTAPSTASRFDGERLRRVRYISRPLLILSLIGEQGYGHWQRAQRNRANAQQHGAALDAAKSRLLTRGFHWSNEAPSNR